jgi:preprotein translocase subunit SecF
MIPSQSGPQGQALSNRKQGIIAVFAIAAIALHLVLRFGWRTSSEVLNLKVHDLPLLATLVFSNGRRWKH